MLKIEQTLLVSAFSGEIDLLLKSGKFPHLIAGGIGNIDCLLGTGDYLTDHPEIKKILFIGSGGSYPWSKVHLGSFASSRKFYSLEISSVLGISKQIENTKEPVFFLEETNWKQGNANEQTLDIFTNITVNAPSTLTLYEMNSSPNETWSGLDVENLELFGLAKLAERKKISLESVLAITNVVGKNGSQDWVKHWREMSNSLQTFLLNSI